LLKIFFQRLFYWSLTSYIWLYWSLIRSLINSFYLWDWDSVVTEIRTSLVQILHLVQSLDLQSPM
jgi:hypothetical protein